MHEQSLCWRAEMYFCLYQNKPGSFFLFAPACFGGGKFCWVTLATFNEEKSTNVNLSSSFSCRTWLLECCRSSYQPVSDHIVAYAHSPFFWGKVWPPTVTPNVCVCEWTLASESAPVLSAHVAYWCCEHVPNSVNTITWLFGKALKWNSSKKGHCSWLEKSKGSAV